MESEVEFTWRADKWDEEFNWRDNKWEEELKSEVKRWRVRWRDEKYMFGLNIHQAKSGVISNSLYRGWGEGPKIKVVQNGLKHALVLEFLGSDEIFEILCLS